MKSPGAQIPGLLRIMDISGREEPGIVQEGKQRDGYRMYYIE